MNFDQFKQLFSAYYSYVLEERTNAKRAISALESSNHDLFVSLLLEAVMDEDQNIFKLAGKIFNVLLKEDMIDHSLYDSIYEKTLFCITERTKNLQTEGIIANLLFFPVKNQLKVNNDTIFNKFMTLFSSTNPSMVNQALFATKYFFCEEDTILQTFRSENSARLQLLFDKLIQLLILDEPDYDRELFRTLEQAIRTSEYLRDESARSFVVQKLVDLIDSGVTFGYQILGAGLSHLYGLIEKHKIDLVDGISKTNEIINTIDDDDPYTRWRMLVDFWLNFVDFEKNRRREFEEFESNGVSVPEGHYLGLLQQYGDQVIDQLIWLAEEMISIGRTTLLLASTSHWTNTIAKLQPDSFNKEKQFGVRLRFSPSFLNNVLDYDWQEVEFPVRPVELKDMFVTGAAEYIPMYDKTVQEKCIKFACEHVAHPEDARLASFAEMIRLPLAKKEFSDFVIKSLRQQQLVIEDQRDSELKCYQNMAQLYNVPDEALQQFIRHCLEFKTAWFATNELAFMALYHLIKPLRSITDLQLDQIFDKITTAIYIGEKEKHDAVTALLGLVCQKLSSSIDKYLTILDMCGHDIRSYHLFDILAGISPPAGVSHLSHLETIVDLFEKEVKSHVTDDVYIEQAIRGMTAVLHSLKKSSNEFLFVRHIKTIVSALQPALDEHSDPSNETLRAYLNLIRELCTLFQASVILRSTTVPSVLHRACESRDRTVRSLAQTVTGLLEEK